VGLLAVLPPVRQRTSTGRQPSRLEVTHYLPGTPPGGVNKLINLYIQKNQKKKK
jgi:hypothetical protein